MKLKSYTYTQYNYCTSDYCFFGAGYKQSYLSYLLQMVVTNWL